MAGPENIDPVLLFSLFYSAKKRTDNREMQTQNQ